MVLRSMKSYQCFTAKRTVRHKVASAKARALEDAFRGPEGPLFHHQLLLSTSLLASHVAIAGLRTGEADHGVACRGDGAIELGFLYVDDGGRAGAYSGWPQHDSQDKASEHGKADSQKIHFEFLLLVWFVGEEGSITNQR